jgi:hypothetical protein
LIKTSNAFGVVNLVKSSKPSSTIANMRHFFAVFSDAFTQQIPFLALLLLA